MDDTPASHRLTRAERALILACIEHKTDDPEELAARLHVSPKTVSTHFKNIARRLGTKRRIAAILWALEAGVVTLATLNPPPVDL
jgi:DNA-binding CsgD family transcriptional regulator